MNLKRLLCLFLCLAIIPCACFDHRGRTYHGHDVVGPTEIIVDDMGIVHIYADDDEQLFYAAGYQMAVDRLYQAHMLRMFTYGRRTEIVGDTNDALRWDQLARMINLPFWGRMDKLATEEADPERARLIQAWVDGVNKRIQEIIDGEAPLPFGFGPDHFDFMPELWTDEDPYLILKGANIALDNTVEFEVALTTMTELFPDVVGSVQVFRPAHDYFAMPPEDRPKSGSAGKRGNVPRRPRSDLTEEQIRQRLEGVQRLMRAFPGPNGSNSWAVDGRFTDTGRPLIANDPHMKFEFFGSPYPLHLNSKDRGGTYNVAGFAFPGTPGIALGFNEKIMWTSTTTFADTMDIWAVTEEGGGIRIGDQIEGARERTEQFIVREPGMPAGEGTIKEMVCMDVDNYGVIIPVELIGLPVGPYLMNWSGFVGRPARWYMELNRAESIEEFEEAADRIKELNQALVAADANGISYRVGIDVPARQNLNEEALPVVAMDASDAGTLWTGEMLDFDQKPHSRAEQQGFLVTANNDPFGFTADGLLANDPWYYSAFYLPGYRAKRITDEIERLIGEGKITMEDMQTLQMDSHSVLSDTILPLLAEAHANMATDDTLAEFRDQPDLDRIVEILTVEWDRNMVRDSAGAVAFLAFSHFANERVVKDDITELGYNLIKEMMTPYLFKLSDLALRGEYPDGDYVLQDGRDWTLLHAASRTAQFLIDKYGGVEPTAGYKYSDFKRVNFDNAYGFGVPLFRRPKDGCESCINASTNTSFSETATEWVTGYVSVERSVGTFNEDGTPEVLVQFPLGANANPNSQGTQDANSAWLNGVYRKFLFERDEIEEHESQRFELAPR